MPPSGRRSKISLKRLANVFGAVAPVVEHDLDTWEVGEDPVQDRGIDLAALIRRDALVAREQLVLDVQSDDLRVREEVAPHAQ